LIFDFKYNVNKFNEIKTNEFTWWFPLHEYQLSLFTVYIKLMF